jgi:predicted RNase H-like HicB family nuclease
VTASRRRAATVSARQDRADIDARLRALAADPGRLVPWDEVKARLMPTPQTRVVFERSDGWWVVSLPGVPGCYSQGRTKASARRNLLDAVRGIEQARRDGQITVSAADRAANRRATHDARGGLIVARSTRPPAPPWGPSPGWRERYDVMVAELLEAAADPLQRRTWRARYGRLIAEARAAEALKPRARRLAMIRICRRLDQVEGTNLPRGPRFDAACAMELAISRALPGKHRGCCAGCYAEMPLPEDRP